MTKIALITNASTRCGIHQYGVTVHRVLSTSSKFQYDFVPTPYEYVDDLNDKQKAEWTAWLLSLDHDAILYNHCPTTMGWLDQQVVSAVNKPQFLITGHDDLASIPGIKQHFVTNPLYQDTITHSALPRPLVLDTAAQYTPPGDTIKIGTFGLSYGSKRLPLLVQYVNESYPPSTTVELNIHSTVGAYTKWGEDSQKKIIATCQAFARPNVKVKVTTDFITSIYEVIARLNQNDINVFMYENQPHRFAVSSALDLALSARKPIAISNSSMFAHATHVHSIVVDSDELQYNTGKPINWIPDILALGMTPLEEFYHSWAPDKFCQTVERHIDEHC